MPLSSIIKLLALNRKHDRTMSRVNQNGIFTNNFAVLKEKPIDPRHVWKEKRFVSSSGGLHQAKITTVNNGAKNQTWEAFLSGCLSSLLEKGQSLFCLVKKMSNKTHNQIAFTTTETAFLGSWPTKRSQERLGPYFYLHTMKESLRMRTAKQEEKTVGDYLPLPFLPPMIYSFSLSFSFSLAFPPYNVSEKYEVSNKDMKGPVLKSVLFFSYGDQIRD